MKEFEIVSGTIVASDPCYKIPTWCQGIIENVRKGTWLAKVDVSDEGAWGMRIASLTVVNKDALNPQLESKIVDMYSTEPLNFDGGVDSGQFGFFDKDFYQNDDVAKGLDKADFGDDYDTQDGDKWYRACAKLTLADESWGVLPNGAVSSSGYGDGSYDVFGIKDENGEYVALSVLYLVEDEEDEEDWEDVEKEENN